MATELMSPETQPVPRRMVSQREATREPTVQEIIASARAERPRSRSVWWLSGLSAALLWASFMPLGWGPLGWICLVPLIALVRLRTPVAWMYTALYAGGLLTSLASLQWMRLGDPAMYIAWIALSLYMGLYFPVFVGLSRVAVQRFSVPLMLAVPLVWTGLEYLRATLMTGFGWYNLSHTQFYWIELIQISDLVGAYGVSFVIAMTAACLAGLLPASLFVRFKLLPARDHGRPESAVTRSFGRRHVAMCLLVFGTVLAYGYVRRAQAEFQEGPRIALVQGNFTSSLKHNPNEWGTIYRTHDMLTGMAVKHQPDVIVWPETMFRWPLHTVAPGVTDEQLRKLAPGVPGLDHERWLKSWRQPEVPPVLTEMSQKAGAAMFIGIDALVAKPDEIKQYNSAAFVDPDRGLSGRYDKLHRVIFGEYIPLREELPWLYQLTPFPPDYGIDAGEAAKVFRYQDWNFVPIICFEDTVPHLVRGIVDGVEEGQRSVDCLVNLTNDGWFHGSSELDQHLITSVFRSVECRTPMVRAVNTGISAIIDGDGVVVEPEVFIDADGQGRTSLRDPATGRWHKQLNAVLVHDVPLDNRDSLYVAYGDWFAATCGFAVLCCLLGGLAPRSKPRSTSSGTEQNTQ